jgi:hypothetical protein
MPATDLRKTAIDAGYIAVGLGVMGFQQAQERGRELRTRVTETTGRVESCVGDRARSIKDRVTEHGRQLTEHGRQLDERRRDASDRAQGQVRATVARAEELGVEMRKRVEPVVEQVQTQVKTQVKDLPERVVQAMEPVAARVREIAGSAA